MKLSDDSCILRELGDLKLYIAYLEGSIMGKNGKNYLEELRNGFCTHPMDPEIIINPSPFLNSASAKKS